MKSARLTLILASAASRTITSRRSLILAPTDVTKAKGHLVLGRNEKFQEVYRQLLLVIRVQMNIQNNIMQATIIMAAQIVQLPVVYAGA